MKINGEMFVMCATCAGVVSPPQTATADTTILWISPHRDPAITSVRLLELCAEDVCVCRRELISSRQFCLSYLVWLFSKSQLCITHRENVIVRCSTTRFHS